METLTLPIYNTEGKEIDKIKLDADIFVGEINRDAIYQAVVAYRAGQRKGLAATKTRGEVSGGGVKPWKQKGTGRARVGSIRSPLWRHGGVVFGPHPRDFAYSLPAKIKAVALKSSLRAKIKENNFLVLEDFSLSAPKTKEAYAILNNLKIRPKKPALLLLDKWDNNTKLAFRNIDSLKVNLAKDTHVYEVLNARKLIITKEGLGVLTARLKK
jgi:large subunit ribosomal protein L4